MDSVDKIIFGDNQFFGINHMSQEKAQLLSEKFYEIENIYHVYDQAFAAGIQAVMLNSNDRASEICNHFRSNPEKYRHLKWYPSIPYPHKYANMVSEHGIMGALKEMLLKDNSAGKIFGLMTKGGAALVTKDVNKLIHILVDVEMKMFQGLDVKVVFLQNIITDLILGFGIKEVFQNYCDHIRERYNATPGFITQNLPLLMTMFQNWGIEEVVICSSINKLGYLMSPGVTSYEEILKNNDSSKYQIMGMSTLASGAIPAKEAYEYINRMNLQSVVFGASSQAHIQETVSLLQEGG
jgi:hypothetical protein